MQNEAKFRPQVCDDGILEVVAVKGSSQMAASKVIGLTPQRLWQARSIQILISEGDPVPIQARITSGNAASLSRAGGRGGLDAGARLHHDPLQKLHADALTRQVRALRPTDASLSDCREFQKLLRSWKGPAEAAQITRSHPLASLDRQASELVRALEEASESFPILVDMVMPTCNRIHVVQARLFMTNLVRVKQVPPMCQSYSADIAQVHSAKPRQAA